MKSVVEDAAKKFEACKDVFATASSGGIGGDAAGGAAAIAQLLERVKADASKGGCVLLNTAYHAPMHSTPDADSWVAWVNICIPVLRAKSRW